MYLYVYVYMYVCKHRLIDVKLSSIMMYYMLYPNKKATEREKIIPLYSLTSKILIYILYVIYELNY